MSEEEDILSQLKLSGYSDEPEEIPEASPFNISEMTYAYQSFKDQAPDLATLAQSSSNSSIQVIAKQLHTLLSAEGYVKYSKDARASVEQAICTFVYQLVKESGEKASKINDDTNINQTLDSAQAERYQKQISDLNVQLKDAIDRAKTAEAAVDEYRGTIDTLQTDYDNVYTEHSESLKKISQLARDNDQSTSNLKNQIDSLEENLRSLKDKLKMSESSCSRLEQQLNEANQELSKAKADLVFNNSKLSNKEEKLESLKDKLQAAQLEAQRTESENQQLGIEINDLRRKLKTAESTLNATDTDQLKNLETNNERLADAIQRISEMCTSQSTDISDLQALQQHSVDLLRQQQELIAQYDSELENLQRDRNELKAQGDGDEKLISTLRDRTVRLEDEINTYKSDEKGNQLVQIKQILKPRFGDADPVETVKGLLHGTTDNEMKEMNTQLFQICEGILKFWSRVVNSNELKLVLAPDASGNKLASSEEFRNKLLIQIARCRQAATQNSSFNSMTFPTTDSIQKQLDRLHKSESENDRELFNMISVTTMAAETLRRFYDRANATYTSTLAQLSNVKDIVNFEGVLEDLPDQIVEKLLRFRALQQQISNLFDPTTVDINDFDQTIDYIYQYMKNSAETLHHVDTDLRHVIDFDGDLADVPNAAVEYITQLARDDALSQSMKVDEVNEKLESINMTYQEEMDKASKIINELENEKANNVATVESLGKENKKLKNEIEELNKELNDINQKAKDTELKYQQYEEYHESLEADKENLRKENANLRTAMEKKSKQFDERLERLMSEERQQHQADLKRQEDRSKKREEKLQADADIKTKKIKELKKKIREIIEAYEKAFKKQKETTAAIKQQNDELNERVNKTIGTTGSNKETDRLNAEVKTLETERLILSTRLKQAQENAEKIQAVRDNYWMAQMTVRESELSKSINEAAAEANDRYENLLDQVVNLLEPYLPVQARATEETAIETLNSVIQRLEVAEKASFSKEEEITRSPKSPSNNNRSDSDVVQSKAIVALQEWDRWGRDLFVFVTDGEVPCQSCKELRYVLGEMILASIANRKIIFKLESLRAQKKYLVKKAEGKYEDVKEEPLEFRQLFIIMLGTIRMMRRAGHFPVHYNQPTTPKKTSSGALF